MSTFINQIVQATRNLVPVAAALEVARATRDDAAVAALNRRHAEITDQRQALTVQALRGGADADTIRWAVGINDSAEKIQAQQAMAQLAAAACADELADEDVA